MPWSGRGPSKWADDAEKKVELASRKVALEAFREVILMSPVDTGRFRGNWLVDIGDQPEGYNFELYDPSGVEILKFVEQKMLQLKMGDTIWLINNLQHGMRLEHGWSQQAPNGMVRIVAARWQPIFEAAVAQVRDGKA